MKHELRVKREFPTQAKSMRQVSLVLSEFFDKSNKSAIKPPDDVDGFFIFRLAHCPPGHDDSSSFLVKARDDLGDISLFSVSTSQWSLGDASCLKNVDNGSGTDNTQIVFLLSFSFAVTR